MSTSTGNFMPYNPSVTELLSPLWQYNVYSIEDRRRIFKGEQSAKFQKAQNHAKALTAWGKAVTIGRCAAIHLLEMDHGWVHRRSRVLCS
jgi:hypothetical protein